MSVCPGILCFIIIITPDKAIIFRLGIIDRESRTHFAFYYIASTVNAQLLRDMTQQKLRNLRISK